MSAKEMFEELGYKETENDIFFKNTINLVNCKMIKK